jgi:Zn-dependent M16 (insulinase) family peptidase
LCADEKYLEKLDQEEQARLAEIRATLSQDQINDIIEKARILKERQEEQQSTPLHRRVNETVSVLH